MLQELILGQTALAIELPIPTLITVGIGNKAAEPIFWCQIPQPSVTLLVLRVTHAPNSGGSKMRHFLHCDAMNVPKSIYSTNSLYLTKVELIRAKMWP